MLGMNWEGFSGPFPDVRESIRLQNPEEIQQLKNPKAEKKLLRQKPPGPKRS